MVQCVVKNNNKRLSYRRGTTRRAMSFEILPTALQLYEQEQD